jgi:hypothetical protein
VRIALLQECGFGNGELPEFLRSMILNMYIVKLPNYLRIAAVRYSSAV